MQILRHATHHTAFVLVASAILSCRPDVEGNSRPGWSGEIRDSAGIVLVSNPATGIWTGETRWTAERDLLIGAGLPNGAEYEFGRIAAVDADANGRIYILDNQAARVGVYEPDGRYALSFGRPGRGPGEFSIEAFAVRADADGTVAVRDGINQRDSRFAADGTFLRIEPFTAPFKESAALRQGNRVERVMTGAWDGLLQVASDGTIIDTIMVFEYDRARRPGVPGSIRSGDGANRVQIRLLPTTPSWGVTGNGRVVTGISNRYRLEVRRPDGVLEMLVDKEHASLVMDSGARARMLDRLRELMRSAGLSDQAIAGVFDRFTYLPPDSLPAFTRIVGGPGETIWVQNVLPVDSMTANSTLDVLRAGSPVWDVFCGDGRFLGQITLPARFTLMNIKGSFIYGIEKDDLDVERVIRLAVQPPGQALQGRLSC
jgi:hypothetical protein